MFLVYQGEYRMAMIVFVFCERIALRIRHDYSVHPKDSPRDVMLRMRDLRPAFELRAHWSYNNLVINFLYFLNRSPNIPNLQMYMLGSHLVTRYSGTPYTEYVRERIFSPLNMTSTTYRPSEAAESGKATENWTGMGRRIPWWFTDDQVELIAGPGGVISNVPDMVCGLYYLSLCISH